MNRQLLLWRHGRTAWNADGLMQGQLDVELDAEGLAQADAAAVRLATFGPAAIVTSDLARAAVTAAALAAVTGLPARADRRLREVDLGGWQGLTGTEAAARYPQEYAAWTSGVDVRRGGGETYAEVAARASAALCEALAEVPAEGLLIAVTHGGTARATIGAFLDLPGEQWWRLAPLGNCCWSLLREAERGWRLAEHNVRAC